MTTPQISEKRASPGAGPVYVYIWFDIEDYVTEESDDLPLVAASILEKYGAKATCKMVAEKVRVLLERERRDVISAIAHHDVGYHLDTHSRHPVVYEYLAHEDTLDGADEFARKESQGLALVEKTFSRRASCYGHPGPAWASHYYPAMKNMGISVYLDETPILNLSNGPYWYCGILNLNGANENFVKFDYTFESPEGLQKLKAQFREIHERLAGEGGGSVSFLFHLHTAINKEFWDAVNFAHGQNRTKDEYVRPPAQPREVTERAWGDLDAMMAYMSSFEDVRFITATDALTLFRTSRPTFDKAMLGSALAQLGDGEVRYVEVGDDFASPSELLYLIVKGISSLSATGRFEPTRAKEPLGPKVSRDLPPPSPRSVKAKDLVAASTRLVTEIDHAGRLPAAVDLGDGTSLPIADFMVAAAKVLGPMLAGTPVPPEVEITGARFVQSRFVRPEEFEKACRWVVLPEGFSAPRILEEIVRQTWTLRPAVMVGAGTAGRRAS
ncbi:MAG: hypothetical protein ABSF83_11415 [Nitrososphaerales archaeon]